MKRTGIGLGEPEEEPPSPDLTIRITLPEELAGWVLEEVMRHEGSIKGLDVRNGTVIITASLRTSHWEGLNEIVTEATQGRGKVERVV